MSKFTMALARPFMPPEDRLRLRHQRLAEEAVKRTGWMLRAPEISVTLVKAVDSPAGGGSFDETRLVPARPGRRSRGTTGDDAIHRWFRDGAMQWDGQRVTIIGTADSAVWYPAAGGLWPGFDPVEVLRAGHRPVGAGDCPKRVAAIATVGLTTRPLHRIAFLDVEARELGWIPAYYFTEEDVIKFAHEAGIAYRSYSFAFAGYSSTRISPDRLCEALFVPSARWVKLVSEELHMGNDWFTDYKRADGSI